MFTIKIADLSTFDLVEHLKTEADVAADLSLVLEEDDSIELAHALGVIARARGLIEIASSSGMSCCTTKRRSLASTKQHGL